MRRKLFSFFALLLMAVTSAWADVDMKTVPLTLEAKTAGTIVVSNPQSGMQYSLNGGAKTAVTCDPEETFATISVAKDDKVAFYGNGTSITSYFDSSDASKRTQITGGTAECYIYGNIMSLVDETGFATATALTGEQAFRNLFRENANLYNHPTNVLVLPATTLTESCYRGLFWQCANLTAAPALPATTLTESCYRAMFWQCTNLASAPELSATTLADNCYNSMFHTCSSLNSVPANLPATTLTDYCYSYMFMNCTSLTAAPELPAITTAENCYRSMFAGCTNLTAAPELPATTLATSCYQAMFQGCTNLTAAPELPATTLANNCYRQMFYNCTKLNVVTCLATNISATDATTDWLAYVAATGTFIKTTSMTGWPRTANGIPSTWTVVDYDNVTPLTLEAKTAGTIVVSNPQSGMKYSLNGGAKTAVSASITVAIGDKVQFFGNGTSITSYNGTQITGGTADCYIYGNIMSLVDENGFATATTLTANNAFSGLFNGNARLFNHGLKKLVLPATTLTNACYQGMFSGCTNLTTAPELPATTLTNACYQGMFSGCTSLTAAPALLAKTLAQNCYYEMFSGCTNLNSVTCLATNISATDATTNWLYNVAATGTFTRATSTSWPTDSPNGIPSGWTATDNPRYSPLVLEAITDGTIVVSNPPSGMQYSLNGGAKTAVTCDPEETFATINVTEGQTVAFYGNGTSITSYNNSKIGGTADCYIYGNIMSLVDEENFATATTLSANSAFKALFYNNARLFNHATNVLVLPATSLTTSCYQAIFQGCTGLTTAPELPAKTLTSSCYYMMFKDCTGLTTAPELPAKTLTSSCYRDMFIGCTSLTAAPELPATTLASYCYRSMFNGCTKLETAPELSATTLAESCYQQMFQGCTGLTTAPANLPATTLTNYCYAAMFYGCTSLTVAPVLPATTLVDNCYNAMFYNCKKLNTVTCLATNISATTPTSNWLGSVAATGTFIKAPSMTSWSRNVNGIPSAWTVYNGKVVIADGDNVSALSAYAGVTDVNVTYSRTFTEGKPSTVCLPFAYEKKTGEKFYTFTGITKDGDDFVATMTEYAGATLVANTPYLYVAASTGATDFSDTYDIPADITAGTTTSGDWKFVGTYTTTEWGAEAPTGIYGFSAKSAGGIGQGEFVKVGSYVRVKPLRCYLMYKDGTEDYEYKAAKSLVAGKAAVSEPLPEIIKVRLIDADGEVTGIGTMNTQTGEVDIDSDAWYTLDGVLLREKPTKKGIYVHGAKKVMINF